jgi:predicted DNA-binding protein YlxM (UPF0122 family)
MSARHYSSLSTKLRAIALVEEEQHSIREIANALQIPKSTLHDNLPIYRSDLARFMDSKQKYDYHLVRNVLIQTFDGKTSSRSCATTLSKIMDTDISHQTVLHILDLASETAHTLNNENLSLATISCAAFDEIFQRQEPILGFVDPRSALVYLQAAGDRSGDTWSAFLKLLKELGLDPKATVTDGGSGLLKGIRDVFSGAIQLRDLFHVLHKLSKARRVLEGKCYAMIAAEIKLMEPKYQPETLDAHRIKMNDAIALFDLIEANLKELTKACYLSDDESPCYVTAAALRAIVKKCLRLLDTARRTVSDHRAIKEAMTYLQSGLKAISAYKEMIETEVEKIYGPVNSLMVLQFICPIIEYLDQYRRAHESQEKQRFWGEKIAKLRANFRQSSWVDQNEVDQTITLVSKLMDEVKKSNSLMESVNSVIRCHLQTYKSIPRWFCSLFTFYWNNRKFPRGKRKGLSPIEILAAQESEIDWVDLLLKTFPFDKLHRYPTPTLQTNWEEKNPAA